MKSYLPFLLSITTLALGGCGESEPSHGETLSQEATVARSPASWDSLVGTYTGTVPSTPHQGCTVVVQKGVGASLQFFVKGGGRTEGFSLASGEWRGLPLQDDVYAFDHSQAPMGAFGPVVVQLHRLELVMIDGSLVMAKVERGSVSMGSVPRDSEAAQCEGLVKTHPAGEGRRPVP